MLDMSDYALVGLGLGLVAGLIVLGIIFLYELCLDLVRRLAVRQVEDLPPPAPPELDAEEVVAAIYTQLEESRGDRAYVATGRLEIQVDRGGALCWALSIGGRITWHVTVEDVLAAIPIRLGAEQRPRLARRAH